MWQNRHRFFMCIEFLSRPLVQLNTQLKFHSGFFFFISGIHPKCDNNRKLIPTHNVVYTINLYGTFAMSFFIFVACCCYCRRRILLFFFHFYHFKLLAITQIQSTSIHTSHSNVKGILFSKFGFWKNKNAQMANDILYIEHQFQIKKITSNTEYMTILTTCTRLPFLLFSRT